MNFLKGAGVAMITPFDAKGEIDFDAIPKIVEHIIAGGINYLVIMGTTAETATLSSEEKKQVIDIIIEANSQRIPLVLGIGGNNTKAVVSEIKNTNLKPFEVILSVSPYYNRPTQEGIYQHFKQIALSSAKPILLYNVPPRTATAIENETTVRLANDFSNIIGTKEAPGDLESVQNLLKIIPNDFHVISGDDALAVPVILSGGSGVISVIGGALPSHVSKMTSLALNAQKDAALACHEGLASITSLIFKEGNPAGVKALSEQLGLCSNYVRLPLVPTTPNLYQSIGNAYKKLENF